MARLDKLPTLNGFRGVAILLVMWFHLPRQVQPGWALSLIRLAQPGYFGVDFFFVLSGFLITRILIHDRERRAPLKRFIVRRFLRIFPIYYLLLLILALLHPSVDQLWAAAYLSNFASVYGVNLGEIDHTWSLAVEEQFYILWPLLIYFTPLAVSKRLIPFAVLPGAVLFTVWLIQSHDASTADIAAVRLAPPRVLSLGLGGLFAFYEAWLRARNGRLLLIALVGVLAGAGLLKGLGPLLPEWWLVVRLVGGTLISGGAFLLFLATPPDSFPGKLISRGPLPFLGLISYGLYLYHQPIYSAFGIHQDSSASAATTTLGVAATLVVATLSYILLEKRIDAFKDRLTFAAKPIPRSEPGKT